MHVLLIRLQTLLEQPTTSQFWSCTAHIPFLKVSGPEKPVLICYHSSLTNRIDSGEYSDPFWVLLAFVHLKQ